MASPSRRLKCAIYTRKSTEEGLDQAFNSLDAQREACAAYVMSQQREGWTMLADSYDDGGYSGGNLERPALQQLLADVRKGRVDVVVVYKIDRLTRSLADFAKIVEVLDAAECSFVSVTQAFNTTNSMGRLTLNVLLSFAQFEREVIAERIRDKVAASKAKGMWMGGGVPLGYEVRDRKLIVVPREAQTVRVIMERYLATGSMHTLLVELKRDGIVSKRRIARDGSVRGGVPFRRGALYWLLSNPVYVGETRHRDKTYPGEHEPIVSTELFSAVQAKLAERTNPASPAVARRTISLLAGMFRDAQGRPMSPAHTQNHGKRYRYYCSKSDYQCDFPAVRLPAREIDAAVRTAIAGYLADTDRIRELASGSDAARLVPLIRYCQELAATVTSASTAELRHLLQRLACAVTVGNDCISVSISATELFMAAGIEEHDAEPIVLAIPVQQTSSGQDSRLRLCPPSGSTPKPDPRLVDLVVRSFAARDLLLELDEGEVAAMPPTRYRHLERIARLAYLDPAIIAAILEGTQPRQLQARTLWRLNALPLAWCEQRQALGIAA